MRTLFFSFLINILILTQLSAGEGMWLPMLLEQLNETEMQAMGMKMSAEDIYSVNQGSLKDAIVHFGGFCTGEIISNNGLVLTNHHCGYDAIQKHSTLENDYLKDGFWASKHRDELMNKNLFVTFIISMADVTDEILKDFPANSAKKERKSIIDQRIEELKATYPREDYQDLIVKPFFSGNQYFIFVTEKYSDIRLVGTPPSSIGKFGADTDNWEFPRHTGDFSLFRIYTAPDGKPASPSANNVPMKPRHHLPISLDGVEVDDFTLVFGFPGRTDEYLPAVAIDHRVNIINPIRIGIRDRSLAIVNKAMRINKETRLQYASKQAKIANGWKKWKGETQGIKATDAINKKKALEAEFEAMIAKDPVLKEKYGNVLGYFDALYARLAPYAKSREYVNEIMYRNIEIFALSSSLGKLVKGYKKGGFERVERKIPRIKKALAKFYKDYNSEVDKEIMISLLKVYFSEVNIDHQSQYAKDQIEFGGGDVETAIEAFYQRSFLTKGDMVLNTLDNNPEGFFQQLSGDNLLQFAMRIQNESKTLIFKPFDRINTEIKDLQRKYMAGLMEAFPSRRFYPDANGTMRVTYGKVEGYSFGGQNFSHSTYLDGLIDKYVPFDYEFHVPAKLRQLHKEKDYGQYADAEGRMPVCFIGSNHTSGGNSGSPVIDAHGNFVGINFDRTWHGTMSDVNYDPTICRNIMVDARYILFIIDKYAGAKHLIREMTLVHPKKG